MPKIIQPKLPRVQFYPSVPGSRYIPSNGTEGEFFHSMWCEECARDKVMSGQATTEQADADPDLYCSILNDSFQADGVAEWVYGEDGQPCCTAFEPLPREGEPPTQVVRDDSTIDMFGGS